MEECTLVRTVSASVKSAPRRIACRWASPVCSGSSPAQRLPSGLTHSSWGTELSSRYEILVRRLMLLFEQ